MRKPKNDFEKFIKTLTDLDTPLGDFARDAFRDDNFLMKNSEKEMVDYLEHQAHVHHLTDVFEELKREYKHR